EDSPHTLAGGAPPRRQPGQARLAPRAQLPSVAGPGAGSHRRVTMRSRTRARLLPLTVALALGALAGCGSDEPTSSSGGATQGFTPPEVPMDQPLGAGEGQGTPVAWAGSVEGGACE